MARTVVAGHSVPGIILLFIWVVVVIVAVFLLSWVVHWAGGGLLNAKLGHFFLHLGFS